MASSALPPSEVVYKLGPILWHHYLVVKHGVVIHATLQVARIQEPNPVS